MDSRYLQLQEWLVTQCHRNPFTVEKMIGDASFRRYYRIKTENQSYVAMDAPPATENCISYIAIANALRAVGLCTPEILHQELNQGFLLISDFGDRLYLQELTNENAEKLYLQAIDALSILQTCQHVPGWQVPNFTAEFMRQELEWFKEWFLQKNLNLTLEKKVENELANCFDFLAQSAANQKQVFMHRDYHSANLMLLPNDAVGILDFQDAFIGPITYDLVSLLRDCYINWPADFVNKIALHFWGNLNLPSISADQFICWFDLMGIQRHLKALLTFSRKYHRDNNPNYLKFIPPTVDYILQVSANYPQCAILKKILKNEKLCAQ